MDIQKIKISSGKIPLCKEIQNICCLVFSTRQTKHHVNKHFKRGTKLKDTNEKSNTLPKHFHQLQRQMTFHYQKYKILQKTHYVTHHPWSFKSIFLKMDEPNFFIFLAFCLSKLPFTEKLIFSSIVFENY